MLGAPSYVRNPLAAKLVELAERGATAPLVPRLALAVASLAAGLHAEACARRLHHALHYGDYFIFVTRTALALTAHRTGTS